MSKNLENLPPLSQEISELLTRRAADLLILIKIKEHALNANKIPYRYEYPLVIERQCEGGAHG